MDPGRTNVRPVWPNCMMQIWEEMDFATASAAILKMLWKANMYIKLQMMMENVENVTRLVPLVLDRGKVIVSLALYPVSTTKRLDFATNVTTSSMSK